MRNHNRDDRNKHVRTCAIKHQLKETGNREDRRKKYLKYLPKEASWCISEFSQEDLVLDPNSFLIEFDLKTKSTSDKKNISCKIDVYQIKVSSESSIIGHATALMMPTRLLKAPCN